MQEARIQPLMALPGQGLPGSLPQNSYRGLSAQQGDLAPPLPPHLQAEQAVAYDRSLGAAALQSYNSSEGSGGTFQRSAHSLQCTPAKTCWGRAKHLLPAFKPPSSSNLQIIDLQTPVLASCIPISAQKCKPSVLISIGNVFSTRLVQLCHRRKHHGQ